MIWYLEALEKYAQFSGRARRKEYWMFLLFNVIFGSGAAILDNALGITFADRSYGLFYIVYLLFIIIPSISVFVRRLHDLDKGGGWYFIGFIPFIGSIWLFVLMCKEGTKGENFFGPDPKEEKV